MDRVVTTSWYALSCPLDAAFLVDGIAVQTVSAVPIGDRGDEGEYGYLELQAAVDIEEFDGVHECARYLRPTILKVLGVVSYLSGCCLSVYDNVATRQERVAADFPLPSPAVTRFVVNAEDKAGDLCILLEASSGADAALIVSLLDRWRRALYLEQTDEAGLHSEEAFLGHFHVLELLVKQYEKSQREAARLRLEMFVRDMLENDLKMRGQQLLDHSRGKSKALNELLLGPDVLSISSKILYMLEQMGLADLRTHRLVGELVQLRNEVAHGRVSYRDAMLWPLPPHFVILSQHTDLAQIIGLLTARSIAAHLELEAWSAEWDLVLGQLDPPLDLVKAFVAEDSVNTLSLEAFEAGEINHVRPSSVAAAAIAGSLNVDELERCLGPYLEAKAGIDVEDARLAFAVVLLCDATDSAIAARCHSLYESLSTDSFGVTNEKDILRILEDRGHEPLWLRSRIDSAARA